MSYWNSVVDRITEGNQHEFALPCSIGLIECQLGDGVTLLADDIATQAAFEFKRDTLIVNCRKPQSRWQRKPSQLRGPGLCEVLANKAELLDVVVNSNQQSLSYLPPGDPKLLGKLVSDAFPSVVNDIRSQFPISFFVLPPLRELSFATQWLKALDHSFLVVRLGKTQHAAISQTRDDMLQCGIEVDGVILNQKPTRTAWQAKWL